MRSAIHASSSGNSATGATASPPDGGCPSRSDAGGVRAPRTCTGSRYAGHVNDRLPTGHRWANP